MNDMSSRFIRDAGRYNPTFDLAGSMRRARADSGKSFAAQVRDIYRLGRTDGRLTAQDYYYYRLYDDARYTFADKARFLGEQIHFGIIAKCCDRTWWAAADDKFLAYRFLAATGFPVPETQAVYDTSCRGFGNTRRLDSATALGDFLAHEAAFPLFAKPLDGVGSFGACRIDGFDDDCVALNGNMPVPLDAFAADLAGQGYLLQSLLLPHPDLAAMTPAVATVRVILIVTAEGPRILHTVAKIPANGNIADNYWREGNMLAAVDPASGKITRVVRGFGPDLEEPTHHPDSGAPLLGLTLPDWPALTALCLDGARLYSATRYQSWDIALAAGGPVAVEVNTGSAFNLAQIASGSGFLTDEFADFLAGCGYRLKHR